MEIIILGKETQLDLKRKYQIELLLEDLKFQVTKYTIAVSEDNPFLNDFLADVIKFCQDGFAIGSGSVLDRWLEDSEYNPSSILMNRHVTEDMLIELYDWPEGFNYPVALFYSYFDSDLVEHDVHVSL